MDWLYAVLLALAVVVLIAAEWPRIVARLGVEARRDRDRAKRKSNLKLLRTDDRSDSEKFAASVERDLAELPTIERDPR